MLVCSGMLAMWGEGNKKVVQILLLNFWSDFKSWGILQKRPCLCVQRCMQWRQCGKEATKRFPDISGNHKLSREGKEVKVERKTKNYYESSACHSHMTPGLARLCIPGIHNLFAMIGKRQCCV